MEDDAHGVQVGSTIDPADRVGLGRRPELGRIGQDVSGAILVHGHRDVKTPNLLLTDDTTRVKLGDLGVAVPMDEDGTADVLAYSPQLWTAPETYTVGRIDRRADLYSMGIVLHDVLSGPL